MRRSPKVWLAIGGIVVAHNITADDGDTLSECMDAWIKNHPVLAIGGIYAVALHLANTVPGRYDVIHAAFTVSRKWRRP